MSGTNAEGKVKNIEKAQVLKLAEKIDFADGEVVSLTLVQDPNCRMTLFAIDGGEGLSSHSAPGDALVQVLVGSVEVTISDVPHTLHAGEAIVIPSGASHALHALEPFKMLLTVVPD
ncbi:MAG: cupin domain-containing protein [Coriobacteriales bacterium]|jgi:quercetin dioxygenase-like cupin family protein